MIKNETITMKKVAFIGEEIGLDLGTQFIKDYQTGNPTDAHYYVIGRKIIDEILSQPGCVGMRFYNAYNEMGEKTFVYVGLNEQGKAIVEYTCVNNEGVLESNKGIVADRAEKGGNGTKGNVFEEEGFAWTID